MQGGSSKPRRWRHCPAQTGGSHRRAQRETVRHTVGRDGPTPRGLTLDEGKRLLPAHWRRRMVLPLIVSVLTGCSVATGTPTSVPVTGPHSDGSTSSPQIG